VRSAPRAARIWLTASATGSPAPGAGAVGGDGLLVGDGEPHDRLELAQRGGDGILDGLHHGEERTESEVVEQVAEQELRAAEIEEVAEHEVGEGGLGGGVGVVERDQRLAGDGHVDHRPIAGDRGAAGEAAGRGGVVGGLHHVDLDGRARTGQAVEHVGAGDGGGGPSLHGPGVAGTIDRGEEGGGLGVDGAVAVFGVEGHDRLAVGDLEEHEVSQRLVGLRERHVASDALRSRHPVGDTTGADHIEVEQRGEVERDQQVLDRLALRSGGDGGLQVDIGAEQRGAAGGAGQRRGALGAGLHGVEVAIGVSGCRRAGQVDVGLGQDRGAQRRDVEGEEAGLAAGREGPVVVEGSGGRGARRSADGGGGLRSGLHGGGGEQRQGAGTRQGRDDGSEGSALPPHAGPRDVMGGGGRERFVLNRPIPYVSLRRPDTLT